jgi:Tol biopolymer transport system component
MAAFDYLDFDLLIERTGDRYRARVLSSPGGEARADFTLPFTREQLQIFVLKAINLGTKRRVRRIESPDMQEIKAFGRELFDAIFENELGDCLRLSRDQAERNRAGLRIRLRLDESGDGTGVALSDVPWEFMYDAGGDEFLCLSNTTPVVRYQDLRQPIERLAVKPPLRLLVMISAPRDAPALDVAHEQATLDEALRDPIEKGLITVDRMEEATLERLQRRLRRNEYHIFHFIGHGGYGERGQGGVLLFENAEGRSEPVSAEFLRTLFQNKKTLRLAVLNACEGARTDPTDPFAGVAQSLVRGGVAAVIAMQFEISDEAAIILSSEFYSALADGYPVDAALAEARTAVYTRSSAVEWAIPVLYLRSPDASIFDVEAPPPISPRPPRRSLWQRLMSPGGPNGDRRRRRILVGAAVLAVVAAIAIVAIVVPGPTPPPVPPPTPVSLQNKVVFVHDGDIMWVDPDSGDQGVVRRDDANPFAPSISPDGTQLLFAAYVDGSTDDEQLDVFRANADGSGRVVNLTEESGADGAPSWSPDGDRIVFETMRDGNFEIYVMDADGRHLKNRSNDDGDDRLPEWSPDGRQIAFESDRGEDNDIWIMEANGDNAHPLVSVGTDDGAPVWSPDGEEILYRSGVTGEGGHQAWVMDADGLPRRPLTDEPIDVRSPAWSPDGRRIVFASEREDGYYDLFVVDVDGGVPRPLTSLPHDARGSTWCCFERTDS